MQKNQLVELLETDIWEIVKNEEEEVNFLLQLDQKDVDMLLKNKQNASFIYNIMRNIYGSPDYNYIICKIIKVKEKQILSKYIDLTRELANSPHLVFVIEKSLEIKNWDLLVELMDIARNKDLLSSEYYEHILTEALKIYDDKRLFTFARIATNKYFIELPEYYEFVIEKALQIKDSSLLSVFYDLLTTLLPVFYELRAYDVLINYKFVIEKALEINNPKVLESFIKIATDKELIKFQANYEFLISEIVNVEDKVQLDIIHSYAKRLCSLLSNDFKYAITKALELNDRNAMRYFFENILSADLFQDKNNRAKLIEVLNLEYPASKVANRILLFKRNIDKLKFVENIYNINSEKVLNLLDQIFENSLFEGFKDEEVTIIFNSINDILKIDNEEVIIEMLSEIISKIEQINIDNENQLAIEKLAEETINQRKIVKIITSGLDKTQIFETLDNIPADEDITPETFVKKFSNNPNKM